MSQTKEPVYPLPQSVLSAMTDFLCDDSTTGKIGRGSILLSTMQAIAKAGPLEVQAKDPESAAPQEGTGE